MLDVPAQVDSAVFSTADRPTSVLVIADQADVPVPVPSNRLFVYPFKSLPPLLFFFLSLSFLSVDLKNHRLKFSFTLFLQSFSFSSTRILQLLSYRAT
jgi:hypothetical protein